MFVQFATLVNVETQLNLGLEPVWRRVNADLYTIAYRCNYLFHSTLEHANQKLKFPKFLFHPFQ